MDHAAAQLNLFGPKPSKADITNHAARAIIGAEAERREAKTAEAPAGET